MQRRLHIGGMSCVSCAKGIQNALERIDGVQKATVNFATSQAQADTTDHFHDDAKLVFESSAVIITLILFGRWPEALTEGKPEVTDVIPMAVSKETLITFIASLESHSQHPLAKAVLVYANMFNAPLKAVSSFQSMAGKGIKGSIEGKDYTVGSIRYAQEEGIAIMEDSTALEKQGKTLLLSWSGGQLLGMMALSDKLKPSSLEAVKQLEEKNILPILLTGDHLQTAEAIAKQAGIEEFYADVLPESKTAKIQELKRQGFIVGMAGDGINDAPALAAADVGFAMGSGSDIAIEIADVTLVKNDLMGVADVIDLSHATVSKVKQNLFFAFIYNIIGIPLAAFGWLNPMVAAAAMAMSSVFAISNALLLRKWKPKSGS